MPLRCRPAPVMYEIAEALTEQARAGRPLVVMNAPFDLTLLDRELRRHRASSLGRWLERTSLHVLDPRVLDKHPDRYREGPPHPHRPVRALRRGVGGAHDAAADAQAALEVVRAVGVASRPGWSASPRGAAHPPGGVARGQGTRAAGVVRAQRDGGAGGPGLAVATGPAGGGVTFRPRPAGTPEHEEAGPSCDGPALPGWAILGSNQ